MNSTFEYKNLVVQGFGPGLMVVLQPDEGEPQKLTLESVLTKLGKEGWRVKFMVPRPESVRCDVILERENFRPRSN